MTDKEILAKAKIDYPIGTVFRSSMVPSQKDTYTVKSENYYWWRENTNLVVNSSNGPSIYTDGRWAEIVSRPVNRSEIINTYSIF